MSANDIFNERGVQTRTTFSQRCSPSGPGTAQRYDGHITSLADSSVIHEPEAGDRRLKPDLGAQFGDRQVGGPGHSTSVDDPQGNRGTSPSPHVITEKAFYTEIQPTYYVPNNPNTYQGQQITALRVDLTQGSTAFRANCVVVRGTMSVVNQPIAGTSGKFGIASDGFVVNQPYWTNSIIPTIDFEHIWVCQPLASLTTDSGGNQWPTDNDLTTVGNANPPGPGDASGYFSDVIPPYTQESVELGRVSTKNSNYFRIRNRGFNPDDTPAAGNFDWESQELPLATAANTTTTNYARFSNGSADGGGTSQPWNLGNSAASDISAVGGQIVTNGEQLNQTYNLNWVDFKYSFRNCFLNDWMDSIYGSGDQSLGYAPRVAIKGTYLLI